MGLEHSPRIREGGGRPLSMFPTDFQVNVPCGFTVVVIFVVLSCSRITPRSSDDLLLDLEYCDVL